MINQRLFGSPISGSVKKKLEDRQRVAGDAVFGESIEAVFPDKDGKNQADLSSRTPFARMWTSVKFIQPEQAAEVYAEIDNPYKHWDKGNTAEIRREGYKNETQFYEHNVKRLQPTDAPSLIIPIKEPTGAFPGDTRILKWIIKASDASEKGTRERMDFSRNVYIVGDNNYETSYGTTGPNDSIVHLGDSTDTSKENAKKLFPNELQDNDLLKPKAGITSVTSETEGTLGVIKKTTIDFTVHNFYDYDRIYNRYFLKPGATIFVDFGWSSVKNLYKPDELITSPNIKKFIYDDTDGVIPKNKGDLEVIQGIVTDYTSKILSNGSVECSVTLTSSNSALLGFETTEMDTRKIEKFLNKGVLYLGIQSCIEDRDNNNDGYADDMGRYLKTPNLDSSVEDIDEFNSNLISIAKLELSSTNLTPKNNSVRTGIYIDSLTSDNVYVSWGVIEDIVFNANFGFGKGVSDTNKGENLNVRLDSSYSFATFNETFLQKQKALAAVSEPLVGFLYPQNWGNSDSIGVSPKGEESYTYQNKKYPVSSYPENVEDYPDYSAKGKSQMHYDKTKNRIPIRELFISSDIIMNAFNGNDTVIKIIKEILEEINKASDNIFDLRLTPGQSESELRVVDNNRPEIQALINESGISDSDKGKDAFADMFIFNIMSPNSIVNNYDLSFNLPQGNIGNMYAISAMGHENKLFPLSDTIDDAVAINALDKDSLSIIYEPDNSGFRSDQLDAKDGSDAGTFDFYQNVSDLISTDIYKTTTIRNKTRIDSNDIKKVKTQQKVRKKTTPPTEAELKKKNQDLQIQRNIDKLKFLGYKVVKNFSDYYKVTETQEIKLKQKPNLLPFTLSLTTYGIGSIVPGDTFRVDYLPQIYQKNVYLQTMKIINNINGGNWTTTLETQFRPLPEVKKSLYIDLDTKNIRLSPKIITNAFKFKRSVMSVEDYDKWWDLDKLKPFKLDITNLIPSITDLDVHSLSGDYKFIDMVLSFSWVGTMEKGIEYGGRRVLPVQFPTETDEYKSNSGAYRVHRKTHYGYGTSYESLKASEDKSGRAFEVVFPVKPTEEEIKKPWYFIIQKSFWAIIQNPDEINKYDFDLSSQNVVWEKDTTLSAEAPNSIKVNYNYKPKVGDLTKQH